MPLVGETEAIGSKSVALRIKDMSTANFEKNGSISETKLKTVENLIQSAYKVEAKITITVLFMF